MYEQKTNKETFYLPHKQWCEKDIKKLIYMKDNHFSLKEIADSIGVSVNAISKALSRYHTRYIKIKEDDLKTNDIALSDNITSLYGAIKIFNQYSNHKIYCYGNHQRFYEYHYQYGLSKENIMILINTWLLKRGLKLIKMYALEEL